MKSIEKFIEYIIHIRKSLDLNGEEIPVEKGDFHKVINGLSYKITNPKAIGLLKKMSCLLYRNQYLEDDDVIQETLLCIILAFLEFERKGKYSIEESIRLFLINAESDVTESETVESKMFYKLLEKIVKCYLSIIQNQKQKRASMSIHGEDIKVVSFHSLKSEENEETMEDLIDRINIKNNLYLEEAIDNSLMNWLESQKVILTKGELNYLANPLESSSGLRTRYQKNIEKKLSDIAVKEFGTTKEVVVKDILEFKIIDKILSADDFQKELITNIDSVDELIYRKLDSFEILKDLTSAINNYDHICKNINLIKISKVLWDRLEYLQDKIKNLYKVETEEKQLEIIKEKFDINLIEGIDTSDSEVYRKRINGKEQQSWVKFRKMHKKAFEENIKVSGAFMSYSKFCKWLEDNHLKYGDGYIYHSSPYEYNEEKSFILPNPVIKFLLPTKVTFIKGDGTYRGVFRFNGKSYVFTSTDNPIELDKKVRQAKSDKLREIAEANKENFSTNTFNFLVNYKF